MMEWYMKGWYWWSLIDVVCLSSSLTLMWFVLTTGIVPLSWFIHNIYFWIVCITFPIHLLIMIYYNWDKVR